jgi:hypothetical protein
MSTEENKALVRREQEELWNHTGDLDAAGDLFAPEQAEAAFCLPEANIGEL